MATTITATEGNILSQEITFEHVISPLSLTGFLANHWEKQYLYSPGKPGRFHPVFTWSELNRVLDTHRLRPPRLGRFQDGRPLDPARYLTLGADGIARMKVSGILNCLSSGATLVLNQIDECSSGVRQLAEAFEACLQIYTTVNLYAGWRMQKGFGLHWDPQETVIIQIAGRKRWQLYGQTRPYPMKEDVLPTPKPTRDPVWEGILSDGDSLYIPRGCWHVATPVDEPSLHLTFTIVPARGTDLLQWFLVNLRSHEEIRMDVPHLAGASERARYLKRMGEVLARSWNEIELDAFLSERTAKVSSRPTFCLPNVDAAAMCLMDNRSWVSLKPPYQFKLESSADGVSWCCAAGTKRECPPAIKTRLNILSKRSGKVPVSELSAGLTTEDESALITLLRTLAIEGVLAVGTC